MEFSILPASKCSKRDVNAALAIYCKTVDLSSQTNTNEIKDYIWNTGAHRDEPRTMLFYILYGEGRSVKGFAEFGYLPENQALVIDYICTEKRNHVLFYIFYHLAIEDIQRTLLKKGACIRYILTELSLAQANGKLTDPDSNYFRRLLSNESFYLLKYPYYQPPLSENAESQEFNLAIRIEQAGVNAEIALTKQQYLSLVTELYHAHYESWFKNYMADSSRLKSEIDRLLKKIESEFPSDAERLPIAFVQCKLFEEGQCPNYTPENVTLHMERRQRHKHRLLQGIFMLLAIMTFVFCAVPCFSQYISVACSFLTIIAGIISIWSVRRDFLDA